MTETTIETPTLNVSTPLPYHRLALKWAGRLRLRPLWAVLVAAAIWLALVIAGGLMMWLLGSVGVPTPTMLTDDFADQHDPANYLMGNVGIALMLPAVLIGFAIFGARPGTLSSVAGRLRWGWLAQLSVAALAIWALTEVAATLWGISTGELGIGLRPNAGWLVVVILLSTPFQAAAEEYVFRGALPQMLGAWLKHPVWAFLLPVPLFAIGHDYDLPGLAYVSLFALAAGWLTWRTGGLEAAVAMHVINNTVVSLTAVLGLADLNETHVDLPSLVFALVPVVAFVAWVEWRWRTAAR